MTTPHLTPKPRTPDQVSNFLNRKRDKPANSKSSIWNCQTEPHGTVGVLTVPFSGRYVQDLESLKAMESHSVVDSFSPRCDGGTDENIQQGRVSVIEDDIREILSQLPHKRSRY